ncbi:hypothetical protein [Bradyrhizobium canariense]|uniref:Uncharacterized protein n=1 Tax=Bradyrhizobium canariense TaxID=255045 RepID=A0A1H1Y5T7_9BRAD|nr:hypothetical protein [Bradyrhizobium canariense]SDT16762.1 hypothetical protein SAMN05444158_4645 [Bradyrhizobium canariense]
MTAFGTMQNFLARDSGIAATSATSDSIWAETARAVIEQAHNFGDEVTVNACQRVIDDDSCGDLPAQSDVNVVLSFLDLHTH